MGALVADLGRLLRRMDDADASLKCDDVMLEAHRTILAARSPVMARMLRDDPCVNLDKEYSSVVTILRDYMYTDALPDLEIEQAVNLVIAANYYDIPSLKEATQRVVQSGITLENAVNLLEIGVTFQVPEIFRCASNFVALNFQDVMTQSVWVDFMRSEPEKANEIIKTVFTFGKRARLT